MGFLLTNKQIEAKICHCGFIGKYSKTAIKGFSNFFLLNYGYLECTSLSLSFPFNILQKKT